MRVPVREEYDAYVPDRECKPYVEDLLRVVPRKYLRGLGFVLFHEIGHHIHETQRPEFREPENIADRYAWQLMGRLVIRRWYLVAMAVGAFVCLYPVVALGVIRRTFLGRGT